MKKLFVIIPIILILAASFEPVQAQKKADYDQCLFVNPFGLIFGILNAGLETQVSAKNSFLVTGYLWTGWENWIAYGIGGSYRWYFDAFNQGITPIQGLGVGPAISVNYWDWKGSEFFDYDGGVDIAIGGEAVYKWIWGGFALEPGIQIMYHISDINGLGNISPFGAMVSIGYAW